MPDIIVTRSAGLAAMQVFVPNMGRAYETGRNFDYGPGRHTAVSALSPYLRRRLITEAEVVAAALAAHGPDGARVFIDEVIWRNYFKGWLERRPRVWDSYVAGLNADMVSLKRDRRLRRDVELAESGQTGFDYFDSWVHELIDTGYLHNHARMWFASIWIFTLGLPWRLGADFFYRHLLDGDAAANTLNWRWAAGLHTRGKPYPARAENIATFTGGRFSPRDRDLARVTKGLEDTEPDGLPNVQPVRDVNVPQTGLPTAVLVTDEDCSIEDFDLSGFNVCGTATLACSQLRSPRMVANCVKTFEDGALADAAARLEITPTRLFSNDPADLAHWAADVGARQIVTPFITCGPLRDWVARADSIFAQQDITFCELRRDWDDAIWPHATAGFFKVRKEIPRILKETGLT